MIVKLFVFLSRPKKKIIIKAFIYKKKRARIAQVKNYCKAFVLSITL